LAVGQDKIVRIFAELMRNMSRMKRVLFQGEMGKHAQIGQLLAGGIVAQCQAKEGHKLELTKAAGCT